jgi:hypothetical protein
MPKKKSKSRNLFLYNILIVFFAIIIVGFIYSFAKKTFSNGVEIPKPDLKNEEKTAIELYAENPISDITIEILNGCGEQGIAAKAADFLRSEHIDVIRSENADNFDYQSSILIQHSDDLYNVKTVAEILDFNLNNKNHVIFLPESDSDVDLTLIIGSDYHSIKPLRIFLANL